MSARQQQLAAFYAEHAQALQRATARKLHAPMQLIEDACQTAWMILVDRDDIGLDHQGLAWLRKVALHAGYRAAGRPELSAGGFLPDLEQPGELADPPSPAIALEERITDRLDRRSQLQALSVRERRYLTLQALGLSYHEIAIYEQASLRTVERQLQRGRRKLDPLSVPQSRR